LNRRKYKEYRKGIEDEKGGWRTEREIGEAKGGFGKENQRITYLLCYSRARTLANKNFPVPNCTAFDGLPNFGKIG